MRSSTGWQWQRLVLVGCDQETQLGTVATFLDESQLSWCIFTNKFEGTLKGELINSYLLNKIK